MDCWRVWQHITGVASIVVGYSFFHGELGEGYWRKLRNPHGMAPRRRSSHSLIFAFVLVMYVVDAVTEAFLHPVAMKLPFVVGFSKQVLWSLCNFTESTSACLLA